MLRKSNAGFLINRFDNDFQNAVDNNNVEFVQDYINKNNLATLTPERRNEVITLLSQALRAAAFYGRTATVKALLAAGVDVNATDKDEDPALIAAANNGHADTVNVLLTAKDINVNITCTDNSRETALMCASRNGYATIVKALLAAGARVDLTNQYNETALICAITECNRANRGEENYSYIECINALLATPGIDLSIVKNRPYHDENGTALFVAIKHHRPDAVKALIAAGADVNASDLFSGHTPLSLAAVCAARQICISTGSTPCPESVDTFQALLAAPKIDLEAKNAVGRTALEELYIPHDRNPLTYRDMIAKMLRDSLSSKEKSKPTPLASTTLSHGFFAREQNPHEPSDSTLETALDRTDHNTTELPRLV